MGGEKNDEIDLVELLLKGIGVIRANLVLIVSFFVLGSLLGFAYYYSSKKIFENKMLISSEILTESYCKSLIADANRLIREGNYQALSEQLGVPEKIAREISSIAVKSPLTNEIEIGKESDRKFFHITLEVYDQEVLVELQKGLTNYLENNEFVKARVNQKKDYFQQTIAKLEQEIKDLEILKADVYSGEFFKKVNGNAEFDPTTINSKIIELTKEKINLQHSLELVNSVHIVEGFTRFQKPSKPKLSLSLVAGSMVGLFFVGALIAFKSIRKLLAMAAK
jgi:hypothetical protein